MLLPFRFLLVLGVFYNAVLCDDKKNSTASAVPEVDKENSSAVSVPSSTISDPSPDKRNNINVFALHANKYIFPTNGKANQGPVIWSPLSVYKTLLPLYYGAGGSTLEELKNCLNLHNDNDLAINFKEIFQHSHLRTFTGVFMAQGITVNPSYQEKIEGMSSGRIPGFRKALEAVDFKQDVTKSVDYINSIVANKTDGMIKKLLDPSTVSPDTKMIVLNTILFKGKWRNPFDSKWTKKESFHGLRNSSTVDMMTQKGTFEYGKIKRLNATIAQLDYADSTLACLFVLPDEDVSVESVWEGINQIGAMDEILTLMEPRELNLTIPKMHVESDHQIKDSLTKMGLATLFTPQANLSKMIVQKQGEQNDMYVSQMLHKTVFETNEEGTKAAAVTSGMLIPLSNFASRTENFRVDRPFILLLTEPRTETIIFMGCVTELTSGEQVRLSPMPSTGSTLTHRRKITKTAVQKTVKPHKSQSSNNPLVQNLTQKKNGGNTLASLST